jgi:hypothetical protein
MPPLLEEGIKGQYDANRHREAYKTIRNGAVSKQLTDGGRWG